MFTSRRAQRRIDLHAHLASYFKTDVLKIASSGPGVMRERLLEALELLNKKATAAKASFTLWLIGGGCMMLHLDARESTADLDVIPRKGETQALLRFAEEVAYEMAKAGKPLPSDWINIDFAPQLMTLHVGPGDFEADARYRWSNLAILFAKPELMLALKCFSMRPEGSDMADIKYLMNRVPVRDLDHLYDIIEHYGDIDMLQDGDDILLESMFKRLRAERT